VAGRGFTFITELIPMRVFFPIVVAFEISYSALFLSRGVRRERRMGCWSRPSPTATCGQRRISPRRVLRVAAIRDTKVKGDQLGILFVKVFFVWLIN
jgi:hypothetical protein